MLIKSLLSHSSSIAIHGFYCHAGHSYSSKSLPEAKSYLNSEIHTVTEASRIAGSLYPDGGAPQFVLSVGSTPTAHAAAFATQTLNATLELHAGNYVFHDLQQLGTSLIQPAAIAHRVVASVVSVYPVRGKARDDAGDERGVDEAMVDIGGLSLSKDTGPIKGWGKVVAILGDDAASPTNYSVSSGKWLLGEFTGWTLSRISQEHGVLAKDGTGLLGQSMDDNGLSEDATGLSVGAKAVIIGQHACLIAAAQVWYYVVDSEESNGSGERVRDIWVPWKGW